MYWLLKSEPDSFSIDDLLLLPDQTSPWDGVRNYQARNMLRAQIKKGAQAFFYHSSCKEPAIVGIVNVVREGYPDPSAFNPDSCYYDAKSQPEKPVWYCVDVQFIKKFKQPLTLQQLRKNPRLKNMVLLRPGNRLSVMPVTETEWHEITSMQGART